MPPDPQNCSAEEFLRQDRWLRHLVASIAGQSQVDDIVQDTWTAALQDERGLRAPRAWLMTVARNFVWREHRGSDRRDQREEDASRPEALPSTEETLAWIALQQRVSQAVQELQEPYRSAVLWHYFHGRSVREIADDCEISEANARQRLKRGRDRLRRALDGSLGRDWPSGSARAFWILPGVVEMKVRKSFVVVCVLLLLAPIAAIAVLRGLGTGEESLAENSTLPLNQVVATSDAEEASAPLPLDNRSTAAERQVESPEEDTNAPSPGRLVQGRVLDVSGAPLASIGVGVGPGWKLEIPTHGFSRIEPRTRSASDGTFEWTELGTHVLLSPEPGWVPVATHLLGQTEAECTDRLLVVARAAHRTGTVVDSSGRPLTAVSIQVTTPELLDFPTTLEGLIGSTWLPATSDANGRFELRDLPAGCTTLVFESDGFESVSIPVDDLLEDHLEVTLKPLAETFVIVGHVLTPQGAGALNARVGLGDVSTRTGRDGEFLLELSREEASLAPRMFHVASPPWRTHTDATVAQRLLNSEEKRLELEVVFAGEALAISGHVESATGEPVPELWVYLWRQAVLADDLCAEEFARSKDSPVLNIGPGIRVWDKTDEHGAFRLEGLDERGYTLRIFDPARDAGMTTGEVMGGTAGHVFRLPSDFIVDELQGRVIDAQGLPIEGVNVGAQVGQYMSTRTFTSVQCDSKATTDEDGRFTLRDVPGSDLTVNVTGASILSNHKFIDPTSSEDLVLRVERRCEFRVILDDEELEIMGFQVLDALDEPMTIAKIGAGEFSWSSWGQISERRTRVLVTGQSAAAIVLWTMEDDQMVEAARQAVTFSPNDVNEVRF